MGEHIDDRMPILAPYAHKESWHERKMKRHVKLVAISEVGTHIGRPLIGFREEYASLIGLVNPFSYFLQIGMSLRQVLTDGAFPLKEIGNSITAKTIKA